MFKRYHSLKKTNINLNNLQNIPSTSINNKENHLQISQYYINTNNHHHHTLSNTSNLI
jgi:hypothetical protein